MCGWGSIHPRSQCVGGMLLVQWCHKHVLNCLNCASTRALGTVFAARAAKGPILSYPIHSPLATLSTLHSLPLSPLSASKWPESPRIAPYNVDRSRRTWPPLPPTAARASAAAVSPGGRQPPARLPPAAGPLATALLSAQRSNGHCKNCHCKNCPCKNCHCKNCHCNNCALRCKKLLLGSEQEETLAGSFATDQGNVDARSSPHVALIEC